MITTERRKAIVEYLIEKGKADSRELQQALGLSSDTIRGDIRYLHESGNICKGERKYGGAYEWKPIKRYRRLKREI